MSKIAETFRYLKYSTICITLPGSTGNTGKFTEDAMHELVTRFRRCLKDQGPSASHRTCIQAHIQMQTEYGNPIPLSPTTPQKPWLDMVSSLDLFILTFEGPRYYKVFGDASPEANLLQKMIWKVCKETGVRISRSFRLWTCWEIRDKSMFHHEMRIASNRK